MLQKFVLAPVTEIFLELGASMFVRIFFFFFCTVFSMYFSVFVLLFCLLFSSAIEGENYFMEVAFCIQKYIFKWLRRSG